MLLHVMPMSCDGSPASCGPAPLRCAPGTVDRDRIASPHGPAPRRCGPAPSRRGPTPSRRDPAASGERATALRARVTACAAARPRVAVARVGAYSRDSAVMRLGSVQVACCRRWTGEQCRGAHTRVRRVAVRQRRTGTFLRRVPARCRSCRMQVRRVPGASPFQCEVAALGHGHLPRVVARLRPVRMLRRYDRTPLRRVRARLRRFGRRAIVADVDPVIVHVTSLLGVEWSARPRYDGPSFKRQR